MNKQFIASLCVLAIVGMAVGVGVEAGDTVTATVTPETVEVTIDPATFDYGIMGTSSTEQYSAIYDSGNNIGLGYPSLVTATVGNTGTDLNIRGVNATGAGSYIWTLDGSGIGPNQYMHAFTNTSGVTSGNLTAVSQTLEIGVIANGSATFDLQISTPSTVTEVETMSVPVTVVAVTAEE